MVTLFRRRTTGSCWIGTIQGLSRPRATGPNRLSIIQSLTRLKHNSSTVPLEYPSVTILTIQNDSGNISWNILSREVLGDPNIIYNVYINNSVTNLTSYVTNDTKWSFHGLSPMTTYCLRIVAVNQHGEGPISPCTNITTKEGRE